MGHKKKKREEDVRRKRERISSAKERQKQREEKKTRKEEKKRKLSEHRERSNTLSVSSGGRAIRDPRVSVGSGEQSDVSSEYFTIPWQVEGVVTINIDEGSLDDSLVSSLMPDLNDLEDDVFTTDTTGVNVEEAGQPEHSSEPKNLQQGGQDVRYKAPNREEGESSQGQSSEEQKTPSIHHQRDTAPDTLDSLYTTAPAERAEQSHGYRWDDLRRPADRTNLRDVQFNLQSSQPEISERQTPSGQQRMPQSMQETGRESQPMDFLNIPGSSRPGDDDSLKSDSSSSALSLPPPPPTERRKSLELPIRKRFLDRDRPHSLRGHDPRDKKPKPPQSQPEWQSQNTLGSSVQSLRSEGVSETMTSSPGSSEQSLEKQSKESGFGSIISGRDSTDLRGSPSGTDAQFDPNTFYPEVSDESRTATRSGSLGDQGLVQEIDAVAGPSTAPAPNNQAEKLIKSQKTFKRRRRRQRVTRRRRAGNPRFKIPKKSLKMLKIKKFRRNIRKIAERNKMLTFKHGTMGKRVIMKTNCLELKLKNLMKSVYKYKMKVNRRLAEGEALTETFRAEREANGTPNMILSDEFNVYYDVDLTKLPLLDIVHQWSIELFSLKRSKHFILSLRALKQNHLSQSNWMKWNDGIQFLNGLLREVLIDGYWVFNIGTHTLSIEKDTELRDKKRKIRDLDEIIERKFYQKVFTGAQNFVNLDLAHTGQRGEVRVIDLLKMNNISLRKELNVNKRNKKRNIQYDNTTVAITSSTGHWSIERFINPAPNLTKWSVLLINIEPSVQNRLDLHKIMRTLKSYAEKRGFNIDINFQALTRYWIRHDVTRGSIKIYENILKMKESQFILVFLPDKVNKNETHSTLKTIYKQVKIAAERTVGVVTQCINFYSCLKKYDTRAKDGFFNSLVCQINAKLNGINHSVQTESKNTCLMLHQNTMIIGGCILAGGRDKNNEKINVAGVASTYGSECFTYKAKWCYQRPGVYTIENLRGIISEHLKYFMDPKKSQEGLRVQKPTTIIYYRLLSNEKNFETIESAERLQILSACRQFQGNYKPKIVVIGTMRKHRVKFFPQKSIAGMDNVTLPAFNAPPGTVIDSKVVHPLRREYFLISHTVLQGVAQPTKYIVAANRNTTMDILQNITYNLAHMYALSYHPIGCVPAIYYALRIAEKGKLYMSE
ncbi:hypothetical protein DMENIID0001_154080 [Sergentomyia squamirostris]